MKTIYRIAALALVILPVAHQANAASAAILPAERAHAASYTCEMLPLSRVAFRQEAEAEPAPCCTGLFGCPQLLANTGLSKPKHAKRT